MRAFVAGTDTGVGKTYATSLLVRSLRENGIPAVGLKPVCCGGREDAELLRAASGGELSLDETNPVSLNAPLAPLAAARAEGRDVSFSDLVSWFRRVSHGREALLVEGAGGWLVPLAEGRTMADLAVAFELPVLLVAANRLGCVNHTLLTLESIRSHGLPCMGIVLNSIGPPADSSCAGNRTLIEEISSVPVLWEISPGQHRIDPSIISRPCSKT